MCRSSMFLASYLNHPLSSTFALAHDTNRPINIHVDVAIGTNATLLILMPVCVVVVVVTVDAVLEELVVVDVVFFVFFFLRECSASKSVPQSERAAFFDELIQLSSLLLSTSAGIGFTEGWMGSDPGLHHDRIVETSR